jgi:hypothetical protein
MMSPARQCPGREDFATWSSPAVVDGWTLRADCLVLSRPPLELGRRELPEHRVPAAGVVEALDEVEHGHARSVRLRKMIRSISSHSNVAKNDSAAALS